ncbi:unnamed protein product [Laminaria digitata]
MGSMFSGLVSSVESAATQAGEAASSSLTAAEGALKGVESKVGEVEKKVDSMMAGAVGGGGKDGGSADSVASTEAVPRGLEAAAGVPRGLEAAAASAAGAVGEAAGKGDASFLASAAQGLSAELGKGAASFEEAVKSNPYAQDPEDKKMFGTCKVPKSGGGCVIS